MKLVTAPYAIWQKVTVYFAARHSISEWRKDVQEIYYRVYAGRHGTIFFLLVCQRTQD